MRKALISIGLLLLLAALITTSLPWDATAEEVASTEEASSWRLRADYFSYDERQGIYTAEGRASLHSKDQLISADRIRLDGVSRQAILEGNVRIEQGENWLESERAIIDLEEETGTIEHGRGFLAKNHFYFSGELVEKLGPETYHAVRGTFTTCDGDEPSWHFRTGDLRVTLEGYGFSKDTLFFMGPMPVFYSPYLVFPAKRKRQSGLLLPRFSIGNLLGFDVDLPFFWATSRSTDATFYGHYMSKRGPMPGAEFRYAASEESKGVLRFDYLRDQEDDAELLSQNFESAPGLTGVFKDRWWLRSKQNFTLPHEINGKMDLDFVSDPDYLRTFETGYSSWKESDRNFLKTFDRGLKNDQSITTRESTLLLNKTWTAHTLDGELHYFQNLDDDLNEFQLQQLPLINYTASRQPIFKGPFFWEAGGEYVYYWREEGTRGQRLNLNPQVILPLRWGPYLQVEPFVGVLGTVYATDRFDEPADSSVKEKTWQSRELFEAGVDLSTEFVRIFRMGSDEGWTKTRHSLRPKVVYEYRPKVDQDQNPFYDTTDRISELSRITYSLTNFFNARLDEAPGEVAYQDFARLEFSQSYDFTEPEVIVLPGVVEDRPFSNIFTQLDLTPRRYVNLTYKNEYSVYDLEFKRHDVFGTFWDKRGDKLVVDYNLQRDLAGETLLSEINGELTVQLLDGVSFFYQNNYRFDQNKNFKTVYQLNIKRQCWGISIGFSNEPDDNKFFVGFSLLGVGELPEVAAGF